MVRKICLNFQFLFSPHIFILYICVTSIISKNKKFCQIQTNFKILHMKDVKSFEIYPVFGCEISFVAIYAIFFKNCFVAIYALLCGKKLSQQLYR